MKKLTFYIGTDPTADSLHLGHLSSFLISKRLKDYGHNPILLVGGGTGLSRRPKANRRKRHNCKRRIIQKHRMPKKSSTKIIWLQSSK